MPDRYVKKSTILVNSSVISKKLITLPVYNFEIYRNFGGWKIYYQTSRFLVHRTPERGNVIQPHQSAKRYNNKCKISVKYIIFFFKMSVVLTKR